MTAKNEGQVDETITYFAQTNFRNKQQPFGIKIDDRRRHFYALGKTGMGKTNMIQNMVIQDIRSGRGVGVIDPHGEFAEECLKAVPKERIKDVIYFNPADLDYPISLNILESVDKDHQHMVASGLIGIFKKLWVDSWGPRLEYILRNAILALLCHPESTLLGINRILVDKQYREEILSYVDDPVVSSFWVDEFSKYNDRLLTEAISPIQNKVGQFLSSDLIRNIVGQPKSSFSVREIMDQKKILIMNLSKGRIGEDNSALLGAMMVTKIQLAAMSRVDIPEKERNDFYLYVDEFQNFATESFASILSEARKYRLNLILAHQFLAQLDETVLNALLGNVGTIVSFRVGAMDTEILEKEFEPVFVAEDLVNLDKYNIYLKLMIDGVATRPFSAWTLPPIDTSDTAKNLEKIIDNSREVYANKRKDVEQGIVDWSGMKSPGVIKHIKELASREVEGKKVATIKSGKSQNKKNNKKKVTENGNSGKLERDEEKLFLEQLASGGNSVPGDNLNSNRGDLSEDDVSLHFESDLGIGVEGDSDFSGVVSSKEREDQRGSENLKLKTEKSQESNNLFQVNCSACGVQTEVNFKPDGVRPVFCQSCLNKYRSEQAKLKNALLKKEQEIGDSGKNENIDEGLSKSGIG